VIVVLQQQEHDTFTRKDVDLSCTYNIGVTEALCGFSFVLKHLDGRDLVIKNPPGQVIEPGKCPFQTWFSGLLFKLLFIRFIVELYSKV